MRSKQAGLVCVTAILIFALRLTYLSSAFISNLAWSHLIRASVHKTEREIWATSASNLFQRAIVLDTSNHRVFLGIGMADIIMGDEVSALSSWQKAVVSYEAFINSGNWHRFNNKWNEALLYYRGAIDRESQSNEGKCLAGQVCQFTFAQPDLLSSYNQAFCQEYFLQNEGNLIVNSRFDYGDTWGWHERHWASFSGEYGIDHAIGKPAPAALIVGGADDQVGGLSQVITLPAGVTIRYSGWFRVQGEGEVKVRLLHVLWQQEDGKAGGNQLIETIPGDADWTYLERTFQIPKVKASEFRFSPALLTGKGIVWIDDVRLELLSGE